jgi:GGDEF domain-containing protein
MEFVETLETVIWSVMLGGMLTIGTLAVADVFVNRTLASWRGLLFMAVTGTSCILLSGLPQDLHPDLPLIPVLILKSSLGPLSGAMVLMYLKQWLGVAADDRYVYYAIHWGSNVLLASALIVAMLCVVLGFAHSPEIFILAAALNGLAVMLATFTSVRAAQLGDQMGRTMAYGCFFLAIALAGLLNHQLTPEGGNPYTWALTSFSTVVFFMIMVMLAINRNRQIRELQRLSHIALGVDPVTGLPRGSVLLSKIDDAFWRSSRLGASSIVICLHIRNLYELSESVGPSVDLQIQAAMAARIRRAVGFRCVVGLYHPRCFVVVLTAVKQPRVITKMTERLREIMCEPLDVLGNNDSVHRFTPWFNVGATTVNEPNTQPAQVIDEAERIALASEPNPPESANSDAPTRL